MCGRFTLRSPLEDILARFQLPFPEFEYNPHFNIAPTQQVFTVVRNEGRTTPRLMRWGLIPSWAKDAKIGSRMINARQETITEKQTFKALINRQRCLIIADGFYEWKKSGSKKIPMYITIHHEPLFAMAGLWDTWRTPESSTIRTCTIITTTSNNALSEIHDRMPVILRGIHEDTWLSSEFLNRKQLDSIFSPLEDQAIDFYPVSQIVNSPQNDVPACILRSTE